MIVGAGTAGCMVAARLSEDPSCSVLLLEAGPDHDSAHTPPGIGGANLHRAIATPGRTWPDLTLRKHSGDPPVPYLQGRGVGGGSSVNGMISMIGQPADYDRWAQLGAAGWAWSDVAPVFARLPRGDHAKPWGAAARLCEPNGHYRVCSDYDVPGAQGFAPARLLMAGSGRRHSANDLYLEGARHRANLEIRGDTLVTGLLLEGRAAVGVRLAGGEEIVAGQVVICAGAIQSPRLLLAAGIDRPGVGRNLRDHPAASLPIPGTIPGNDPASDPDARPVVTALGRFSSGVGGGESDVQLLPVESVGIDEAGAPIGVLLAAVMEARSSGWLTLDEVHSNQLCDELDVARIRWATRTAAAVLSAAAIRCLASIGSADLASASDDEIDAYVRTNLGDYSHISGTCRMGDPADPAAVVDIDGRVIGYERLRVIDASVFPDLPRANPNLTVMMVAHRLADRTAGQLAEP